VRNVGCRKPKASHLSARARRRRWDSNRGTVEVLRTLSAIHFRRYRISHTAWQAFNVSKQLVRQEEHANLLPHVEIMTWIPKYSRQRKPAEPQPAQPPPPPKLP